MIPLVWGCSYLKRYSGVWIVMAEIVLTVIAIALLAERFLAAWRWDEERDRWSRERERLINRIITEHPAEIAMLDRTQDVKPFVYRSDNPLKDLDGYEGQAGLS